MQSQLDTQLKNTQKQTLVFSSASTGGMFESRPFVVQSQTAKNSQQPDLKTSLMQAEKYGHNLNQLQQASFSAQPEQKVGTAAASIQLAKKRPANNGDGRGRGANRNDRKMVDAVAREKGMNAQQRREFGNYIEEVKRQEGRGGADNFTYNELLDLANEFLGR